ncbi:hypothetical protein [Actinomadura litoris]|uniref:Uncharacterized protein n=1 Tax=Actinomadura litoris TaxID=2678616 RepID=A0A7K1LAW7_9ACTN|nr:hypothetical protein [Actinomadura litoris]MUN41386.1 hypothetical protein [Actinomadura litoris]
MTTQSTDVQTLAARVADAIDGYTGPVSTTVYWRPSTLSDDYSDECAPRRTVPESDVREAMARIAQVLRDYPDRWGAWYPTFADVEALRNADLLVSPDWYVYATPVPGQPLAKVIWWTGEAIDQERRDRDPSTAIAQAVAALAELVA